MRGRSLQAALLTGASLFVGAAYAQTKPSAPAELAPIAGRGLDTAPTSRIVDPLTVDRADWAPEPAARRDAFTVAAPTRAAPKLAAIDKTPAAPAGKITPVEPKARPVVPESKASREEDSLTDPEADGVVPAPPPAPSSDPLDSPSAGTETSPVTGKPETGKAEQAKPDSTTPDSAEPAHAAEPPLPALNLAIKAALGAAAAKGAPSTETRKEREAIAAFYAAHDYEPAWSEDGKAIAAVEPLLARLARAGEDALTVPSPPRALVTEGKTEDLAASDIALTEAVVAYARQATGSRVDPHAISPLIGRQPALADPGEELDVLTLAGAEAGDTLQALNPSDPRYKALRGKLAELRTSKTGGVVVDIPPGPTLRIGMRDKRVPLIRSRFNLDVPLGGELEALEYDSEVAEAIADFQRANKLTPSGNLTKSTVAALAGGKSSRLEGAIVANMEMWRWMPRDLGSDRIEVNVPDFMVTVFHEGENVSENRVVVGKTDTPTPLFSNEMKFLIVNPAWNVPQSIIENEMGGGERAGFTARYVHGRLYLQQPPGPKNALGRIKFMFPNPYSVYLHDTPAKHLFSTARRAYSHGCVRVDKPFDFAEMVLNQTVPEGARMLWTQTRLQKMLGDKERYVYLPKPLPIHIEYFTASIDAASDKVVQREDVYGYTRAVAAALGQDTAPPPPPPPPKVAERKPARVVAERRSRRAVARSYDGPEAEVAVQAPARQPQASTGWFGAASFW